MTNTPQHQARIQQDRYALKVAARLTQSSADLPYDITERLRAARVQAVARRKVVAQSAAAPAVLTSGGAAILGFGDEGNPWFQRIASVLPLIALVAGLMVISSVQSERRANDLAEVDAALLTDDLPPSAYADPGFAQFVKAGHEPGAQ
jgi:hypothetical protein